MRQSVYLKFWQKQFTNTPTGFSFEPVNQRQTWRCHVIPLSKLSGQYCNFSTNWSLSVADVSPSNSSTSLIGPTTQVNVFAMFVTFSFLLTLIIIKLGVNRLKNYKFLKSVKILLFSFLLFKKLNIFELIRF